MEVRGKRAPGTLDIRPAAIVPRAPPDGGDLHGDYSEGFANFSRSFSIASRPAS